MTTGSTLIIPIENQVRELDAKILLACVAAERGFPTITGSRAFIHYWMPFLPRGVYVAKSVRSVSTKMFDIARQLGHQIVAWDEESLVHYPSAVYYERRLSAATLRQVSMLFAWGRNDARLLREFPNYPGAPIHVTGNPRIDLMRPEVRPYFGDEVQRLRARFGDFILVNTNFGLVNSFVPSLNLLLPGTAPGNAPRLGNTSGMTPEYARGMARHKQALFEHFQQLVLDLSEAFPDRSIVVRPHPSERHEPWRELGAPRANVHVLNEGNVVPWLMAAQLLIHNGCTTAVEAAVLGTPAVAYQPVQSDEFDFPLPNSLSHRTATAEEVVAAARAVLGGSLPAVAEDVRQKILAEHLAALEGPLAADRIVDVLVGAGYLDRRPPRGGIGPYVQGWLRANVRTAGKLVNMAQRNHRNSEAFHRHRFPGISLAELRARVDRLARQLGRFEGLRVNGLSRHVFRIERAA